MLCYTGYTWEAGPSGSAISNHLRHKGLIFSYRTHSKIYRPVHFQSRKGRTQTPGGESTQLTNKTVLTTALPFRRTEEEKEN